MQLSLNLPLVPSSRCPHDVHYALHYACFVLLLLCTFKAKTMTLPCSMRTRTSWLAQISAHLLWFSERPELMLCVFRVSNMLDYSGATDNSIRSNDHLTLAPRGILRAGSDGSVEPLSCWSGIPRRCLQ